MPHFRFALGTLKRQNAIVIQRISEEIRSKVGIAQSSGLESEAHRAVVEEKGGSLDYCSNVVEELEPFDCAVGKRARCWVLGKLKQSAINYSDIVECTYCESSSECCCCAPDLRPEAAAVPI